MAATLGAMCYGTVAGMPLDGGDGNTEADGAGEPLAPGLELTGALGLAEAEADGLGATLGPELGVELGVALGVGLTVLDGLWLGVGADAGAAGGFTVWPIDVPDPRVPPSREDTGRLVEASMPVSTATASAKTTAAKPMTAIQRPRTAGSPRRISLQRSRLQREGSAGSAVWAVGAGDPAVCPKRKACRAAIRRSRSCVV
jgi:hypothetical protein